MSKRPPQRQHRQEVTRIERQELEKDGAVDGQATADADAHAGVEGAGGDPGWGGPNRETKDAGQEEGHIEGDATADNIGRDSPERGPHTETNEESTSGISHLGFRYAEFFRDGRQGQRDTLEPEAKMRSPVSICSDVVFSLQLELLTCQRTSRSRRGRIAASYIGPSQYPGWLC